VPEKAVEAFYDTGKLKFEEFSVGGNLQLLKKSFSVI
jgi:hypothetical protein